MLKMRVRIKINESSIRYFIQNTIKEFIPIMQTIRNESVHGSSTSLIECEELREHIIGIGKNGFLKNIKINGNKIMNYI